MVLYDCGIEVECVLMNVIRRLESGGAVQQIKRLKFFSRAQPGREPVDLKRWHIH